MSVRKVLSSSWKKMFTNHAPKSGFVEVLKYIGPGFFVTIGFIDPGNWASNVAAGSTYGYILLWVVTLSTLSLVVLQHNAAHLGIVTGLCLSEAASKFFKGTFSRFFLATAVLAAISTALAEILGAAIGLNMLTGLPVNLGSVLSAILVSYVLFSSNYRKLEKWIVGFVSLIGIAFFFELSLVSIRWNEALKSSVVISIPPGALPIVMSVLGAVVMPHNLFLHSEVIQSRQWNIQGEETIKKQLKYEFTDTLFAMIAGFAINSAMIIMAAAVFYPKGIVVTDLSQAQATLKPLLGHAAATVFALALLFAGISSSVTAAMAGGSIFAGIFQEPFDLADNHSRTGVLITVAGALVIIFLLKDPFQGIIWSQILLSIQLPWTIFSLLFLTSSQQVMGRFANSPWNKRILWSIGAIVVLLNLMLLLQLL